MLSRHSLLSSLGVWGLGEIRTADCKLLHQTRFERILTLRLNTTRGPATIVSVYAPTLAASPEEKDMFYGNLSASIRDIPNSEQLFLLGDFNARVGADHNSWPLNLGSFGVGTMNENGQRLLEFCTCHNLVVTNSFFKTKP